MDKLIVEGGHRLQGAVNISGSKNASLPILAAALLTDEPVRISRVPDVSDTNYMIQILSQLGASVERSSGTVRIESPDGISSSASYEQVRKMRASICLLGPMMARMKLSHGNSDSQIAGMMIQGNTRGMITGLKDLHQYQQQDTQVSALSQRLLDCETANIRQMQAFL